MPVSAHAEPEARYRIPLSRDRVLRAAVRLADEHGVEALTMRRLAEDLGAEAMSLYHHVANKGDVLDGILDLVATEIHETVEALDTPAAGAAWKQAVRRRILTAREVLLRHPWAPALFQTRSAAGPAVIRYYDGLLGLMRQGGFSYDLGHHALHALGSRALGFAQELFDPAAGGGSGAEVPPEMAEQLPHLTGMIAEIAHDDPDSTLGWCDDQAEFEFGLDLILDGLDRLRGSR
ncbi:TetR/AcrR family transcriptional regulator C-terminal domain-containing protein [Streptomonospora nanhaiensis]|uniref:AcrR family transcriptional regulator n=1 Tax=Streptomonospora nanhaiensis TaxID=1323731 RepID=A0A853BGT6_9ACTN|nr:TetR/AcrR family transcriptional regulator C-terminal domain-containing protein [Streptomonospora nanhaiensis]MBV2364745.1 TetR/AcrR family transcriptional regulator C-terminal domain-containing protein [Streptomonospora nanhaiensis]NYI93756.1 AcrR family transcriptional regulator [Streptomonospora nanhaiensis]